MKLINNIFADSSIIPRVLSFNALAWYCHNLCACANFVDDKHVNILYVVSLTDGLSAFYTVTEYRKLVLNRWQLTKVDYLNELSGDPKAFYFHD